MLCLKVVKMLIAGCLYAEHESTAIPTITLPCAQAKKQALGDAKHLRQLRNSLTGQRLG
ncbi:MAG: hypothetical protein BWX73_03310 [Lentisphaerae bacterium ADurb.Bin082]|nr:MAG: hypothetical protein BWX73_03310 [Lentisphaerae bacterium ADurb.Bin082]